MFTSLGVPRAQGGANPQASLYVDGEIQAAVDTLEYGLSMQQLGVGLTASSGQVVTVFGSGPATTEPGTAWGYLSKLGDPVEAMRIPPPEEWVTITEQQPFVVPAGRLFVATSGGNVPIHSFAVKVNAVQVLDGGPGYGVEPIKSPRELPIGIRAKPGDVVSIEATSGGGSAARLHGFLIDL